VSSGNTHVVNVFAACPGGGNPAPIVLDAAGMSDGEMQAVALASGHESGFVILAAPDSSDDFEFRFWVPNHEMSMCGHATIGAVWLLHHVGRISSDEVNIRTASGLVIARIDDADPAHIVVEISQPEGVVETLTDPARARAEICEVLGTTPDQLAELPVLNARTSRVKTLVPMRSVAALTALAPEFDRVEAMCTRIGSTGLYPYAVIDRESGRFDARQFPQSSGYREDPATGIAAAALAFGLVQTETVKRTAAPILISQGVAMGRPSIISVRFDAADSGGGCWIGGSAELDTQQVSN
jgi:PhzF family phenazine biosynthesis protein